MKVAILGLPQSGKSTLFTAITGLSRDPNAVPGPRLAMVGVPDPRVVHLTGMCNPKKVTQAQIEFIDLPGVSLDDAKGQAEWKRLLPTIREVELLVVVVRDFENSSVPAYRNRIDPAADFAAVWDELIFADLDAVATRLDRLDKQLKKPTKTHDADKREQALLERCKVALEANRPLGKEITSDEDRKHLSSYSFLTQTKIVCVRNVSDGQVGKAVPLEVPHVEASLALCASIEAEVAQLDPADRPAFLQDLGISEPARDRLIRACYQACGLISFLTMGPDEVRAWSVRKGSSAVEAAAKIHTDLARGFIRAETVAYDDLVACSDFKGARAAGKVRKEGKTYIVQDGDILNILSST